MPTEYFLQQFAQFNNKHSCHNNKIFLLLHKHSSEVLSTSDSQQPVQSQKRRETALFDPFVEYYSTCLQGFRLRDATGAKDGKEEISDRRNVKVSVANHKQARHFSQGKHKALWSGFESGGCFTGEEDHRAMPAHREMPAQTLLPVRDLR